MPPAAADFRVPPPAAGRFAVSACGDVSGQIAGRSHWPTALVSPTLHLMTDKAGLGAWNMGDSQMAGFGFEGAVRRKLLLGCVAAAAVMVAPSVVFAADDLADVKAALARNHAV